MDKDRNVPAPKGAFENPIVIVLGGLAIGFLVGMLLPASRFESERVGPLAEGVKKRVKEAGAEAARRGSDVIKDTIDGGKDAAIASLRENARDFTG